MRIQNKVDNVQIKSNVYIKQNEQCINKINVQTNMTIKICVPNNEMKHQINDQVKFIKDH